MCRPGRLDKLLYVDLPAADERAEIVRTLLARRRVPLAPQDTAMDRVAEMIAGARGEGYSGADLAALVREAGVRALRRALGTLEEMDEGGSGSGAGVGMGVVVLVEDFEATLEKATPSPPKYTHSDFESASASDSNGGGVERSSRNIGGSRTPLPRTM
jgi:ribosome biogenesis ATPase